MDNVSVIVQDGPNVMKQKDIHLQLISDYR